MEGGYGTGECSWIGAVQCEGGATIRKNGSCIKCAGRASKTLEGSKRDWEREGSNENWLTIG
jgi:hypothetical protein